MDNQVPHLKQLMFRARTLNCEMMFRRYSNAKIGLSAPYLELVNLAHSMRRMDADL
jgi:hypothetical protein